jgi:hypothetical protein
MSVAGPRGVSTWQETVFENCRCTKTLEFRNLDCAKEKTFPAFFHIAKGFELSFPVHDRWFRLTLARSLTPSIPPSVRRPFEVDSMHTSKCSNLDPDSHTT